MNQALKNKTLERVKFILPWTFAEAHLMPQPPDSENRIPVAWVGLRGAVPAAPSDPGFPVSGMTFT